MFSLSYTIARLYPQKTLEEKEELVRLCDENGREYEEEFLWQEVTPEKLSDRQVQLNLAMTFYRSQFYYWGAIDEIMRSLESWSGGTLEFSFLSEEDNAFYFRLYTFMGFLNFAYIEQLRQLFLLGTRCLPFACLWDVPVFVNVQGYFARYTNVLGMKDDAELMMNAMELNPADVGTEGKTIKTIEEWVDNFNDFFGSSIQDKVDEFLQGSLEIARLDESDKTILHKILTLYYGLQGGFIWREIEGPEGLMAYDPEVSGVREVTQKKTADDYYLQVLFEAETITPWLRDWEEVVHWLDITGKDEKFIQKMLFVLLEKVDLNNKEQVAMTLQLLNGLRARGMEGADEVLYFDEKDNTFHWNEDFFVPAEETPVEASHRP